MTTALWLLAIQGIIGAFDTLYYHEWKARLPARGRESAPELWLHSMRDFLYGVLFATLPWVAWHGHWVVVLVLVLVTEIVLTLWDFVVEIAVRRSLGDVYAGERVTHAIMGILYGAMIAYLIPVMIGWWRMPTQLAFDPPAIPELLRWGLVVMAVGVVVSGIRDLYAACGLPYGAWPWNSPNREIPNPEYLSITPENLEAWSLLADKISSQSPTAKKTVTGNRVIWQVGDATFERPCGEPILDFLVDILKDTFGKQWGTEQNALTEENRHVVMRWWHSLCELQKESAGHNHRQGQKYQITPSGDAMEFFTLADDLYRLRLVGALRPKLVDRLKHYAEFQGARYECAIAASFVRTGFDIAWEGGSGKKCEFVATQKQSGESIAIEVKSRRWPGTLNEPGQIQLPDRALLRAGVKRLYENALGQCPTDKPCGIFINVNLPPVSATDNFLIPWKKDLEELLAEYPESQPTAPVAETCLVFTNFAWHYFGRMRAQGHKHVITFPQFVKQRLVNQDTFIAIIRAIRT